MTNPDFVALAKAMGVHAIRCDSLTELPAKMKEFMEYDNNKPVLFEARVVKVSRSSSAPSPLLPGLLLTDCSRTPWSPHTNSRNIVIRWWLLVKHSTR